MNGQQRKRIVAKEISTVSAERVVCPYCKKNLPISVDDESQCRKMITFCKHCKRTLSLDTS